MAFVPFPKIHQPQKDFKQKKNNLHKHNSTNSHNQKQQTYHSKQISIEWNQDYITKRKFNIFREKHRER